MKNKRKYQIESDYELELDRIIRAIKKEKAKKVCLQFPDGMKKQATEIASLIEQETGATCLIWLGSCFGACDIPPLEGKVKPKIDMLVQFGHSEWKFQ